MNDFMNGQCCQHRKFVSLCIAVLSVSFFFFTSVTSQAQFKKRPESITMACCDPAIVSCSGEAELLSWEIKLTSDNDFHQYEDRHVKLGVQLHRHENGSAIESNLGIPTYSPSLQDSQFRCTLTDIDPDGSYISDPATLTLEPGVGDIPDPTYWGGVVDWRDTYHSFGISGAVLYNLTMAYADDEGIYPEQRRDIPYILACRGYAGGRISFSLSSIQDGRNTLWFCRK